MRVIRTNRVGFFVPRLAHYAEAFYLTTGQCFRLILAEDGTGHAQHCPYITEWRGRFRDNAGKWHTAPIR